MTARLAVTLGGAVQGVGFRPFVYRLARELDLSGWVQNGPVGVRLEVEGDSARLEAFLSRLQQDRPAHSAIAWLKTQTLEPCGQRGFAIRSSDDTGPRRATVLPDLATCPECRRELFDPTDRRYRYPFLNCTQCGPRWSIIESLPYDRPRTAMKRFALCPLCRSEYEDPGDRRFHAQPNACPACGPRLLLTDAGGQALATHDEALRGTVAALAEGRIVAIKGVGGYHLMVDARNEAAVRRLRDRKGREAKPLAVMAPDLACIHLLARADEAEVALLTAVAAPIVLLDARPQGGLAPSVAPGNPRLGLMLPATPLHHLLLADLGLPVVATSGNLSEEPLCIDDAEAQRRLGAVADLFLGHDRPIVRAVDDSVARVLFGRPQLLRRARGYAPLPVARLPDGPSVLAVGGHQKNSVALALGQQVILGPHVGDLDTELSRQAFRRLCADLGALYETTPELVATDIHPDYVSTREAARFDSPRVAVQHHEAHLAAVLAEHGIERPALGVVWDGTGYGHDGTIWGGEFFRAAGDRVERVAHLRRFRLPGGDAAARDGRRAAVGLLHELAADGLSAGADGAAWTGFEPRELALLTRLCATGTNAPWTTSAGRLFDGVAALLQIRSRSRFEGEAAMALEFAAEAAPDARPLAFGWQPPPGRPAAEAWVEPGVVDWGPLLRALLALRAAGADAAMLAGRFHATLAEMILSVARSVGCETVVVTGGCFQNRRLMLDVAARLRGGGFQLFWAEQAPPNDGGLAVGQAVIARRRGAGSNPGVAGRW